ncbi:maleylpyruvate isomerase family mycothiol-dependent enzyme [Mycolicibacterium mengxianglii]|uniref:maleylpyruvate isomerase family mycothiol-dependent enzyme n=1 Tax=Mycolicibacterium mengxianglii TaxID=2736649 RepID=UPI0018D1D98B|nr:maleylpyruvate isomerase family mycothiol-dependent enzyme [Mycolicibacterium mengxianglii]
MASPPRPVTALDKSDVLRGLFASWKAIEQLMTGLSAQRWQVATALPGWRVHDVVSHVIGTESMLAGVPTPEADCDVSALEHVHNDIGVLNECWVRHLATQTPDDMLARLGDITAERTATLTAMTDAAWNEPTVTPAGPDSYGRFMRIRTFDCWMHEQDIREALGCPASDDELTGPAAGQAMNEIAAGMGFVVGKRGQAPDGARVAIELTGPMTRTIRVAVDGRAAVVDDFGGAEPTVCIRLDGQQFTRLCGGRPMTAARPADVGITGDQEAGRRIVDNLAYVI